MFAPFEGGWLVDDKGERGGCLDAGCCLVLPGDCDGVGALGRIGNVVRQGGVIVARGERQTHGRKNDQGSQSAQFAGTAAEQAASRNPAKASVNGVRSGVLFPPVFLAVSPLRSVLKEWIALLRIAPEDRQNVASV